MADAPGVSDDCPSIGANGSARSAADAGANAVVLSENQIWDANEHQVVDTRVLERQRESEENR